MIHLPASVRVYLCLTACDMRKSFDGLHAMVREHLDLDPFAGHLFVFASRRRDRDQGGKTAAVLRSFAASCQRAGVDPFSWLKDVLTRISSHPITRIAELLPHNWKRSPA